MRLLAEMFDFQMNTVLPLHCAATAHRVEPIWNYEWWVKLWLIGLVIPVYTLFIPLQVVCAASLYFPLAVSKTHSGVRSDSAYSSSFLFCFTAEIVPESQNVLTFFLNLFIFFKNYFSQSFVFNVICGSNPHAESANFHKLFIWDFCFYAQRDKDMWHFVPL